MAGWRSSRGRGAGSARRSPRRLLANGARVAALDLEAPTHPGMLGVACDVSDEAAVDAAFTRVEDELGTVSVLVLNAGIFPIVPFVETTREVWDRTLAINLTGAFLCAHRAIPGMREQRYGRIVAIGLVGGQVGRREVRRRVRRIEGRDHGDDEVDRERVRARGHHRERPRAVAHRHADDRRTRASSIDRIPVGRFGKPEEVAALVCFLASERCRRTSPAR